MVPRGKAPAISPDETKMLFLREGEGLFLWDNGVVTRVSPAGLTARPDYSWSVTGENGFVYSIPGEPGNGAALIIRDENGRTIQLWNRGSAPAYNARDNYVLCEGPTSSSAESGIWMIDLRSFAVNRLTDVGTAPRIGRRGDYFLYLESNALSVGDELVARGFDGPLDEVVTDHVSRYTCDFDDGAILAERIVDSTGVSSIPAVYVTGLNFPLPDVLVAVPATGAVWLNDGMLLNKISGDSLDGLYYYDEISEYLVADSLYDASAHNSARIFAVGSAGIYLLSKI